MKTLSIMHYLKITTLVVFVVGSSSCKKNDTTAITEATTPLKTEIGTPVGSISTASIDVTGGTINSIDGNITLTIPSGALSSTTTISIQPITNNAPLGIGTGYRLMPEGTIFLKPIQLTFHYTEQLLKETLPDFLWVVTQANDGSWNAMLKTVVDTTSKTVTISTTHFSDWALGKFIDFSLTPTSTTIKKGQSVQLKVMGFFREKAIADDEELAPLPKISDSGEGLTPLTPIPPVESRLVVFRVKQWTLNGTVAPVSNSNGALASSGNSATYTAPNKKPASNPVAVSVEMETSNKEGKKAKFLLTSNITVIDDGFHLSLKVDGAPIEYDQYIFNGSIPDPNNVPILACDYTSNNQLEIKAAIVNSVSQKNVFEITVNNPSVGSRALIGSNIGGNDDIDFYSSIPSGTGLFLNYYSQTPNSNDVCEGKSFSGEANITLLTFDIAKERVSGSFSSIVYESTPSDCTTAASHKIEGEFVLVMQKE
jgi:hypothetical protein